MILPGGRFGALFEGLEGEAAAHPSGDGSDLLQLTA